MTSTTGTMLVLGTRPEIIKFAPVIHELDDRGHPFTVVHTGQHYSRSLDGVFFERLELPKPEYNLEVGSKSHERQTGEMMIRFEPVFEAEEPTFVLVQGDTNSALAGALVAAKRDVQLGHVEAGLRSEERRMPEEINRILIDHVADYLFPPTEEAKSLLEREDIDRPCFVTGNTIVDAVDQYASLAAEESTVLSDLGLEGGEYALLTVHRAENVDDAATFAGILDGVVQFAARFGLECVYPVHPRARAQLDEAAVPVPPEIRTVEPLDFLDFLELEQNAAIAFTDSGGVQEETCILGVPCVTVRDSTERPESVAVGANVVAGTEPEPIRDAGVAMLGAPADWSCPFGDGEAAGRIADVIERRRLPEEHT